MSQTGVYRLTKE